MKNNTESNCTLPLSSTESIREFITKHSLGDKSILPMALGFFGCVYQGLCFTPPSTPEWVEPENEDAKFSIRNQ